MLRKKAVNLYFRLRLFEKSMLVKWIGIRTVNQVTLVRFPYGVLFCCLETFYYIDLYCLLSFFNNRIVPRRLAPGAFKVRAGVWDWSRGSLGVAPYAGFRRSERRRARRARRCEYSIKGQEFDIWAQRNCI